MIVGDLLRVYSGVHANTPGSVVGVGIYLGIVPLTHPATNPRAEVGSIELYWKGRIATFDKKYWRFEVANESR